MKNAKHKVQVRKCISQTDKRYMDCLKRIWYLSPVRAATVQASLRIRICFVCLCWGLTSQSTIFQSCRDGEYFRGVKCLAQGHNTAAVDIEPPTSRSGVRHSTTEPPRSPIRICESRGTFRQKARFLAPLNVWACAVKICHDGMLEDTNSLDGAHIEDRFSWREWKTVT